MGLSVISNSSTSINLAVSPAASNLAEGLSGEFATLLSGQTLAAMLSLTSTTGATGTIRNQPASDLKEIHRSDNEATAAIDAPLDPAALVAMIGNPQLQPEVGNREHSITEPPKDSLAKDISLSSPPSSRERPISDPIPAPGRAMTTGEQNPSPGQQTSDNKTPFGTLPEKAANIAAEQPERPNDASSFGLSVAAAVQQRNVGNAHQATISTPLHTEAWPQQFSEKIVWLARNDQQSAQINIAPPQLGPVQITLNLSGDNATAIFSSPHAEVRQAIENSMPQLREMLASAGINLGDANVGANLAQQNQNNPFMMANKNQSTHENAILPANDNAPGASIGQVLQKGRGLVDLFA